LKTSAHYIKLILTHRTLIGLIQKVRLLIIINTILNLLIYGKVKI